MGLADSLRASLTSRSLNTIRETNAKKRLYIEKNNIDNDEGVQDDSEPCRTPNEDRRAPLRCTYPSAVQIAPFTTSGGRRLSDTPENSQ